MDDGRGCGYRSTDYVAQPFPVNEVGDIKDGVDDPSLEDVALALVDDDYEFAGRTFRRLDFHGSPVSPWDVIAIIQWRIEHGLMLSLNAASVFDGSWADLLCAMEMA